VTAIIIPYTNPDLDGAACAIALAALSGAPWTAHLIGEIDQETRAVFEGLGLAMPSQAPDWADVERIWLVDTHHPNQLPVDLPFDRVVCITDHHPGGAPEYFPHAAIENEPVGAAATLVAERFAGTPDRISPAMACLLQAAILSNTLDFQAQATSTRDHMMFAFLKQVAPLPASIAQAMKVARRHALAMDTQAIINSDVKIFDTPHGRIAVGQVEAGGALDLLSRDDLRPCLARLKESRDAASALLNLVDLDRQESALLSTSQALMDLLGAALGECPNPLGIIHVSRLLQRKSDIIPHLL
jgi:manganese-dependent inorganic pyrophosphatase